ncbi:MAG: HupE/UreJ family protein [Sphingobacteriales bacterium]|nr:MAG: HupE/UreJ family protein [Sphingobacteriales bacterium]TAF80114.1 MAG: HupE/UreJ family protein [Sphingobacteriales bacterium]
MQTFYMYFGLGWQHILNWQAYDHILFLAALCGIYLISDWKKVLILVTAFTIGHSLTLALSVINVFTLSSNWIEFFIPLTIVATAGIHIARKRTFNKKIDFTYLLTLFFGLIHGLGFSNYLKSLLGKNDNLIIQLFAFNLGIEIGQIVIVILVLLTSFIVVSILRIQKREWHLFLSSVIFGIALMMAIQRYPCF